MPIYKVNTKISKIDSCSLEKKDFKSLFNLLKKKVKEALEYELNESQFIKQSPEEKRKEIKENVKNLFKLSVHVLGTKGEFLSTTDEVKIFDDDAFPNKITQIIFDSAYYYKQATNQEPMNKLIILFDFKKQNILNFSNPITEPVQNESSITVTGSKDTWVNGVHTEILSFLKEKKNNRNWLHKKHIYDLFLYLLFYPATFWCIYRVTSLLQGSVNIVFLIAVCLYILILLSYILRILFNYTRWIFPFLEFISESGTKMRRHRTTLYLISIGIISYLIVDIVKSILK